VDKRDVKIGGRYGVRLRPTEPKTCEVKVTAALDSGGWQCWNVTTSRRVKIRSARRFIYSIDLLESRQEDYNRAMQQAREMTAELMRSRKAAERS
jgi:hypothetical protein